MNWRKRRQARWLSSDEVSIQKEIQHVMGCASRGESRIITLGVLVFFSTSDGDAWMLDAEDGLANCLMSQGQARPSPLQGETSSNFSIAWDSRFVIEKRCFFSVSRDGRTIAWPGFPADEILKAVQRARRGQP